MILPKVISESQDILVLGSEGPQDGFFSFSSGGYLVGGALFLWVVMPSSYYIHYCAHYLFLFFIYASVSETLPLLIDHGFVVFVVCVVAWLASFFCYFSRCFPTFSSIIKEMTGNLPMDVYKECLMNRLWNDHVLKPIFAALLPCQVF